MAFGTGQIEVDTNVDNRTLYTLVALKDHWKFVECDMNYNSHNTLAQLGQTRQEFFRIILTNVSPLKVRIIKKLFE